MKQYQCQICGYIYDPAQGDPDNHVPPNTPFDKVPPEWFVPSAALPKTNSSRWIRAAATGRAIHRRLPHAKSQLCYP